MDETRNISRGQPATPEALGAPRTPVEYSRESAARRRDANSNPRSDMSGNPVIVAALLRSAKTAEALKGAVSDDAGTALETRIASGFDIATLKALRGDVIFLEMDVGNAREIGILAEFVADRTTAPVVVTSLRLDVAGMRELMQIGVLDVIPQPLDSADVSTTLHKAYGRRHPAVKETGGKRGSIVTFLGSGGGAGSTSLAVQGAYALCRGKNAPSVCLIDLDIQFGTAALLLDADPRNSVLDLLRDPARLDGTLLRGSMVRAHDRLDLLAAPVSVEPIDDIDAAAVAATLETASQAYDRTVVDLPTLWSRWTHAALERSSVIVLVVQLTVPALRQARRQLDMLDREHLDHIPLVVVANRVDGGLFSKRGVSLKDAVSVLRRKIDVTIPDSAAMTAAADAGAPLENVSGGRALQKRIAAMMQQVVEAERVVATGMERKGA